MKNPVSLLIVTALLAALAAGSVASDAPRATDDSAAAFRADMAKLATDAEDAGRTVVVGKDGWLFLSNELRHLGVGRFWGEDAVKVSRAAKPEWSDPLPAIVDFNEQCKRVGVEMIFVPVPPKAVIYPEMTGAKIEGQTNVGRVDVIHAEFYDLLRSKGVKVIDLTPAMLEARKTATEPLYCKTDTHWSAPGIALTADLIAGEIRMTPWYQRMPRPLSDARLEPRTIAIDGDLRVMLDDGSVGAETITLGFASATREGVNGPIAADRQSPIMLLGDSHALVFHIGQELHAQGAGLADVLAAKLAQPLDVVGVRGSGASPSRINLLRRGDNLAGKKVIIWCLTAREFTETQGWRIVPVVKPTTQPAHPNP